MHMDSFTITRLQGKVRELADLAKQDPAPDAAEAAKWAAEALAEVVRALDDDRRAWESAARSMRRP
jgi:hypothetical protein